MTDQSVFMLLSMAVLYFTPTGIAALRAHPNTIAIGMLNLFLGWTFVFWVGALVWSFMKKERT